MKAEPQVLDYDRTGILGFPADCFGRLLCALLGWRVYLCGIKKETNLMPFPCFAGYHQAVLEQPQADISAKQT